MNSIKNLPDILQDVVKKVSKTPHDAAIKETLLQDVVKKVSKTPHDAAIKETFYSRGDFSLPNALDIKVKQKFSVI